MAGSPAVKLKTNEEKLHVVFLPHPTHTTMQFKATFYLVATLVGTTLATTVFDVENAIRTATTHTRDLVSAIDRLPIARVEVYLSL